VKIKYLPLSKERLSLHLFSRTHRCFTELCEDLAYRISPRSVKNYWKYE